jgi:hypothetical protein
VQDKALAPLVEAGLVPDGFVNSFALNMYHDGRYTLNPEICGMGGAHVLKESLVFWLRAAQLPPAQ